MVSVRPFFVWLAGVALVASTAGPANAAPTGPSVLDGKPVQARFETYAKPVFPPAIVFRLPKRGGGVRTFSNARVRSVSPTRVELDVLTYENHRRLFYVFRYSGIRDPVVKAGDIVERNAVLARSGVSQIQGWVRELGPLEHEYVGSVDEMKPVEHPKAFIAAKPRAFDPSNQAQLILIDKDAYALQIRERGEVVVELDIGYGQAKGRKRVQGDLKTPTGMYFVVDKKRKEFGGKWGEYFGGHWIKVNYPNAYDAAWGRENGVVSAATEKSIARAWRKKALTNQRTKLGGGIGFHGWIGTRTTRDDWSADDPHQTWGCILLHNVDIGAHFDRVRHEAMVVLF